MQKFAKQLPKDDLKKFAKDVGKKLVASDFKNNRVEDPTKISDKQEKKVKAYVKQFFEKAVEKKGEHDKRKKEKEKLKLANGGSSLSQEKGGLNGNGKVEMEQDDFLGGDSIKAEDLDLSPTSPSPPGAPSSPGLGTGFGTPSVSFDASSPELKRKRTGDETPGDESDSKRIKEEEATPPPPPPPPPANGMPGPDEVEGDVTDTVAVTDGHVKEESEEEKELRLQEEDLMRENEEAMKMEQNGTLKPSLSLNGTHQHQNGEAMEGVETITSAS